MSYFLPLFSPLVVAVANDISATTSSESPETENYRVTEDNNRRVTESSVKRILE